MRHGFDVANHTEGGVASHFSTFFYSNHQIMHVINKENFSQYIVQKHIHTNTLSHFPHIHTHMCGKGKMDELKEIEKPQ